MSTVLLIRNSNRVCFTTALREKIMVQFCHIYSVALTTYSRSSSDSPFVGHVKHLLIYQRRLTVEYKEAHFSDHASNTPQKRNCVYVAWTEHLPHGKEENHCTTRKTGRRTKILEKIQFITRTVRYELVLY